MHPVVERWFAEGEPVDNAGVPHEVKAHILVELAEENGLSTLVETGTGFGVMISMVLRNFEQIHTIEMYPSHYESSRERFANNRHVHLYLGDSALVISRVVEQLDGPALFFLDAHYSGEGTARGDNDTPILAELAVILPDSIDHVVVIDDARLFGTDPAYPTVEQLEEFVSGFGFVTWVRGDEIILTGVES